MVVNMARKSFTVDVEPKVMKWAIRTSGYTIEELSKKLKTSDGIINAWLEGRKQPTLVQVKNLSKYLKRPIAVFFLPEPPEEKPLPKDYRMFPGREGIFDPKTILAIRNARRLQSVSRELAENLRIDLTPKISHANLTDNARKIGKNYRILFQITESVQRKWRDFYEAFNVLREVIESRNVLVFQTPMPLDDVGGFTLSDDIPLVIVVNSTDQIQRRIFTLMHEFAHIILKKEGIDIPEYTLHRTTNVDDVEKWCNEFASEFLLPENVAKNIFNQNRGVLTETETLNRLSRRYKVSKGMLLYYMRRLSYITDEKYKEIIERPKRERGGEGGPSPDRRCVSEKGPKFISLVSANVNNRFITLSDALDYLTIKSKHYEKILSTIRG